MVEIPNKLCSSCNQYQLIINMFDKTIAFFLARCRTFWLTSYEKVFVLPAGYQWSSIVQQTEILPYLAITDVPLRTPGENRKYYEGKSESGTCWSNSW